MSDENIVDITSRRSRSASSSVWEMAKQLVATEDIREILQVLGDISSDVPEVRLLRDIPNTPEISKRVHDIIYDAVGQLERFEDSLNQTEEAGK